MDELPQDVLTGILGWVKISDIAHLSVVSKGYNKIIADLLDVKHNTSLWTTLVRRYFGDDVATLHDPNLNFMYLLLTEQKNRKNIRALSLFSIYPSASRIQALMIANKDVSVDPRQRGPYQLDGEDIEWFLSNPKLEDFLWKIIYANRTLPFDQVRTLIPPRPKIEWGKPSPAEPSTERAENVLRKLMVPRRYKRFVKLINSHGDDTRWAQVQMIKVSRLISGPEVEKIMTMLVNSKYGTSSLYELLPNAVAGNNLSIIMPIIRPIMLQQITSKRADLLETPLVISARTGNVEVMRALLQLGANPNAMRHTPFREAYKHHNTAAMKLLLSWRGFKGKPVIPEDAWDYNDLDQEGKEFIDSLLAQKKVIKGPDPIRNSYQYHTLRTLERDDTSG